MGLDNCNMGPCPVLKTTGLKLPQQPYKCYNCQNRLCYTESRPLSPRGCSDSSNGSIDSHSDGSITPPASPIQRVQSRAAAPLPGVARQPKECGELGRRFTRTESFSAKAFHFACTSSSHLLPPHYMSLPYFLPHQDHVCPPCQLEDYRMKADREAVAAAHKQYPHLTCEMLVSPGRQWEDWQTKPTLDKYVEEKRSEEKQLWLHFTRKWIQDLKKVRVLVAEEDGLGLLG
jgi:hypothetical protein